ncbi:MAG: hypothetical protein K8R23_04915 [Chthoniobacter sp.]|nr:hypothetical protein [Chthoniobacter sp.]
MKKLIPTISLLLLVAFAFSGCETSGQNALLGAATGAAVGGALHGRGDQALAGAAIGAAGGYLIGKAVQHDRRRVYSDGYYDGRGDRDGRDDRYDRYDRYDRDRRDDDRGYYRDEARYPVGRSTGRYGFVSSPYYPYNRIDVRGIPRGAKVVDPSCDKIFINP